MHIVRILACVLLVFTIVALTSCTSAESQPVRSGNADATGTIDKPLSPAAAQSPNLVLPPPPANTLFLDPGNVANVTPPAEPMSIRSRLVTLNLDLLNGAIAPPGSPTQVKRLPLNLFSDASFIAIPDRVDIHPKGLTLTGKLTAFQKSRKAKQNQTLRLLRMSIEIPARLSKIRVSQAQHQSDDEIVDHRHRARGVPLFQVTPIFS